MFDDPLTRVELDRLRAGAGTPRDVRRLLDQYRRLDAENRRVEAAVARAYADLDAAKESVRDHVADQDEAIENLRADRDRLKAKLAEIELADFRKAMKEAA